MYKGIKLVSEPQASRVDIPGLSGYIYTMYPAADISCLIFDMDGTLTRTNQLIIASFNHVAEKYFGIRLSPEEIIALFGPPEEGGLCRLPGSAHAPDATADIHAGVPGVLHFLKSNERTGG